MLEIKGNLCKSTAKHQNFRLRRAISTEITTKYIVLSHLNPPEGRNFFWRCFSKKFQNQKKNSAVDQVRKDIIDKAAQEAGITPDRSRKRRKVRRSRWVTDSQLSYTAYTSVTATTDLQLNAMWDVHVLFEISPKISTLN